MKNLVPKRRFEEFKDSDPWEQRKLISIAEFNPKGDIPDTFKYVDLESVIGTEMIAYREEKKGTAPSRAQRLARQGDLFYQTVRPYQKNNYLFEKPYNNYVFSTGYAQMRPHGDGYFLLSLMQNNLFVKSVLDRCTGTSYPAISSSDLADIEVFIPANGNEQTQIGVFFKNLENLITLHQRKLAKLKDTKSAYLSEMFPKDGEFYPKRRFAGFTDPWEQRRVKDIFKVTRGYVLAATKASKEKSEVTPYPVYSSQTTSQGLMGYYSDYLYENAITWTTDGANAGTVNYREGKFYCTNVCGVLISEQGHANKMVSEALNKVAWKHVSKVGNPKLMNNVMSEIEISIPRNIEEQMKISSFFDSIDNLITLHQHKLEKLQALKQAYLSEMFV